MTGTRGHVDRTGKVYGPYAVVGATERRYRGEVVWECRRADGTTVYRTSSRLTRIGKRAEQ